MSTAAVASKSKTSAEAAGSTPEHGQSTRETVESIVVAFILAFLFRAFVAEAFVIPTGSMAPTLMGAHKDIYCEHCGSHYQAGASKEFDSDSGRSSGFVTIASTCSNCRGVNVYDLRGDANQATFSGDRILVSKFDYVLSEPQRWDVFVFKFPSSARMNYIKRLVGLPGENLLIRDGDVYTQTAEQPEWTIARKPPHKIKAMRQLVSDTSLSAPVLVDNGWPSLWQPWDSQPAAWKIEQTPERWSAELQPASTTQWLRYYHKFVSEEDWLRLLSGNPLSAVDPLSSRLITDYLAYNSSYLVRRDAVYGKDGRLRKEIDGEVRALDVAFELAERDSRYKITPEDGVGNDGFHWVGDLVGEFDVEVASESGAILLDLVEFGIHFRCSIDVASGQAKLLAIDAGDAQPVFAGKTELTGQTSVGGAGSYRFEFANVDDQLHLWVDGRVVDFDQPATFDSRQLRSGEARRPYWTSTDPLDAAPVAIGGVDVAMTVQRAAVHRDIYYIAVQGPDYSDYDVGDALALRASIPDPQSRNGMNGERAIAAVYAHPEWWADTDLFAKRGELTFELAEDHYFPMGDNSAASSDARAWTGHHYVEERFLLGKALLVFWPHTWNRPVPFTPNFARMGLIR